MLQMGGTVGPRYTAPKISAISYLFRTFSLLIMGDTERPRYTGFRGLSVRGITALQCISFHVFFYFQFDFLPCELHDIAFKNFAVVFFFKKYENGM